jgi:hypothetical protein
MRSLLNSRSRLTLTLAIIITIYSLWSAYAATTGDGGGAAFLEGLSLSAAPSQILVVCHGFGCAYRDQFVLTPARLSFLRATLGTPHSAREERKALAGVVARFDREEGRVAGTVGRIAYAGATTENRPAQMDCINLTANITELLIVLDHNGLLKFHHVGEPVSRGFIVDGKQPHTTAVITEIATGVQWSVDAWTKAYGQRPDIMTIDQWRSRG